MIDSAIHTHSRHPGVVRMRAGRDGRDTRQAAARTLSLKEFDCAADTEFAATLSIVPAFAGMTAVGGAGNVAQGENT